MEGEDWLQNSVDARLLKSEKLGASKCFYGDPLISEEEKGQLLIPSTIVRNNLALLQTGQNKFAEG